jgi:hypothetical protein
MSALDFDVRIHGDQLPKDLEAINRRIKGMTQDITKEGQNIDSVFKKVGAGFATYFTTQAIGNVLTEMVSVRGEFQKFEAVLTNTLNGDNVKANGLLSMISDFAANTPFQLTEITEGFIKLANQGVMQTSSELTKLGDFAAVTGKPIGQLYEAIMDINNPERWKEFGARVTTEGEKVAISFRGQKVEFDRTVEGAKNAIAQLGSMDGVAGTMSVISKTLVGQISNLQDAWDQMLNKLGQSNEGVFSGMITGATSLVNNYERVLEIIGAMVGVFGAAKTAAVVYNLVMTEQAAVTAMVASSNGVFTRSLAMQYLWTERVQKAQAMLNKSMLSNPYVLAAAAIVGLVAGLVILNRRFEESIDAKRKYDEQTKSLDEGYKNRIDNANSLIETLKSETTAEGKRVEALRQLQELYPNLFKNIDIHNAKMQLTSETTKQVAEEELKRNLQTQREYISGLVKERDRIEALRNREARTTDMGGEGISWVDEKKLVQLNQQIIKEGERETQMIIDQSDAEKSKQKEISKTIKERIKEADSIKKLEELQKQWKSNLESATNATDRTKYANELKQIEGALNSMTGKKDKVSKADVESTKSMIEASKDYLDIQEKIKQKLIELEKLNKSKSFVGTSGNNTSVEKLAIIADISDLEKKLSEMAKTATLKPISTTIKIGTNAKEQLEPMKLLTEEERKILELKGKEAAIDAQNSEQQIEYSKEVGQTRINLQQAYINLSRELTGVMVEQLNLTSQEADSMQGMLDAMAAGASGDYLAAAQTQITTLINMVAQSIADRKQITEDYYSSVIQQQMDYNILLNDQLRLNSELTDSIFFKDYGGGLVSSVNALNDAQDKFKKGIEALSAAQAVVGTQTVTNWKNVAIGLFGGGLFGGGVGLFGGKKEEEILKPLLDTFKDLYTADKGFNVELAKTLIANKQVTEETAKVLQNLVDWSDKMDEARAKINGIITDLTGSLGNDLRSALVTAFEDGTDSAIAFGQNVEQVLENIISNMLFNTAFAPLLKSLQSEMYASYGLGADGKTPLDPNDPRYDSSWTDDIVNFYKTAGPSIAQFNKDLEEARKYGEQNGLSLFTGNKPGTGTDNSLTGAVKGITSEEAGLIAGQLMRFADYQFKGFMQGTEMLNTINMQTQHLSEIAKNTKNNTELPTIRMELEKMNKTLNEMK